VSAPAPDERPVLRLVLATANPDKATEIGELLRAELGPRVELLERPASLPDVEETGETLEKNARLKAQAVVEATGLAALADDTGLEVAALGGAPGVRSARYAGPAGRYSDNLAKLLAELGGAPDRRARFRTVALVAFPDGSELVGIGEVAGEIAATPRGTGGFGYDPVFVPDEGDGRSFAEMSPAEKHAVSHRGRALRALAAALAAAVEA